MGEERLFPGDAAKWLVREAQKRGADPAAVLAGTGLGIEWLGDRRAVLDPGQYRRLVVNALRESRDPALGLTAGRQTNYLSHFGFWGYCILSSADWGQAGRLAIKYWQVTGSLVRLEFHDQGETCLWTIHPALEIDNPAILAFAVEKLITALFATIEFTTGEAPPVREIRLSYPAPPHARLYEEYWKTRVLFEQEENSFRMDRSLLDRPIMLANAHIRDACAARCRELLSNLKGVDSLVERIRALILGSPGNFPDARQAAAKLGLAPRTLRRRLKERSTSYQKILDEVRAELAQGYLASTSLTMDEIAAMLGFAETSSFRRSFKKWVGKSAASVRKEARLA